MRVSKDDWRFLELTAGWGVFEDMVSETIGKEDVFVRRNEKSCRARMQAWIPTAILRRQE